MQHSHSTAGIFVQIFPQAVFQETVIDSRIHFRNTNALTEIPNRSRSKATAAQTAQSWHTWVVPAGNVAALHQFAQFALAHNGVVDAKPCKLNLARLCRQFDVVNDPVVKRAVRFKFQCTEGVRNALHCILNGVSKIVHRVNAPLLSCSVVLHVVDPVNDRIAQIKIAGSQVNLRTQCHAAVFKFACFHAGKQIKAFLHWAVTVRADCRMRKVTAVVMHLLRRQLTDISQTLLNQLHRKFIHGIKVIRCIVETVIPCETEPLNIFFNSIHILGVFLGRVCVIHTQIAQAAELFRRTEIHADSLRVTDVQIAVWFRWKTGVYTLTGKLTVFRNILCHKCMNKIAAALFRCSQIFICFTHGVPPAVLLFL